MKKLPTTLWPTRIEACKILIIHHVPSWQYGCRTVWSQLKSTTQFKDIKNSIYIFEINVGLSYHPILFLQHGSVT